MVENIQAPITFDDSDGRILWVEARSVAIYE